MDTKFFLRVSSFLELGIILILGFLIFIQQSSLSNSNEKLKDDQPQIVCDSGSNPNSDWYPQDYKEKQKAMDSCARLMNSFTIESSDASIIQVAPISSSSPLRTEVFVYPSYSNDGEGSAGNGDNQIKKRICISEIDYQLESCSQ